jgi:hypothetical protein
MGSQFSPSVKDIVTEGDVVQIAPTVEGFGGCFLTITEIKPRSPYVVGYLKQPGRPDVPLMTRVRWTDLAFVGKSTWVHAELMASSRIKDAAETAARRKATEEAKAATPKLRKQASRK